MVVTPRRAVIAAALVALSTPMLLAQRGAPPPQTPPPPPTGTGLILGQVLDALSGQPIADATVSLTGRFVRMPTAREGGGPGQRPTAPPAVVTGADGRFVFRDLPAGPIEMDANASGYLSGRPGQARPGGPARQVELAEGERNGTVKIRLWKYGVISGTITDESGEPAVGATVTIVRRPAATLLAGAPQYTTARTDDRGVYRVSTLTPGDYYVVVPQTQSTFPAVVIERLSQAMLGGNPLASLDAIEAISSVAASGATGVAGLESGIRIDDLIWSSSFPGAPGPGPDGRLLSYPTLLYPNATTVEQAALVTVQSGEQRSGIDIQLRLVPAARIAGVVTGADGPARNVGVRLLPENETAAAMGVDAGTTVTRADGTFLFIGIPAGRYRALATKRNDMNMGAMLAAIAGGGASKMPTPPPPKYAQVPVNVGGGDVTGLTLTLADGASVSGRFEFQGSSPKPAPGTVFNVRLVGPSAGGRGLPTPNAPPAAESDPLKFKTPGYPPGQYRITVAAGRGGGPAGAWTPVSAMVDGRDAMIEPLDLTNIDITDVVILFSDQVATINGTVRAGSAPAATATVVVLPGDYRPDSGPAAAMRARVVTVAKSGTFGVSGLRPGDYLIAAVDDSEASDTGDTAFLQAVAKVATRVSLAAGENTQTLQIVKVGK